MTETRRPRRSTTQHAIDRRKTVKAHKPKFRRHESWRYKRLKEAWRKPRGLDNKMRLQEKGWPKPVKIGYGGPKVARGLHPSGYFEVLIHTPDEVSHVSPATHAIRIAHTVGTRKRIQITSLAREREIHVLNPLVMPEVEEEKIEDELPLDEDAEVSEAKPERDTQKTPQPKTKAKRPKRAKRVSPKGRSKDES